MARSFRRHFDVVREEDDQPTIQYPFFDLSGDQFWELVPKPGEAAIYTSGATSGAPSVAELRRRVAYGQFDDRLWGLMSDRQSRYLLRNALIARYFPEQRKQLEALVSAPPPEQRALRDQELPPGRGAAFRHTILDIYDYRCAACGIRVLLNQGLSLVEAAIEERASVGGVGFSALNCQLRLYPDNNCQSKGERNGRRAVRSSPRHRCTVGRLD